MIATKQDQPSLSVNALQSPVGQRITSQLPIDAWHDIIADAILDRLVHNAYKLDLDGQSMRKMKGTIKTKTVDENVVN